MNLPPFYTQEVLRSPWTWLLVALLLFLAIPRYEYSVLGHPHDGYFSRHDRWTGRLVVGRATAKSHGRWQALTLNPAEIVVDPSNVRPRSR